MVSVRRVTFSAAKLNSKFGFSLHVRVCWGHKHFKSNLFKPPRNYQTDSQTDKSARQYESFLCNPPLYKHCMHTTTVLLRPQVPDRNWDKVWEQQWIIRECECGYGLWPLGWSQPGKLWAWIQLVLFFTKPNLRETIEGQQPPPPLLTCLIFTH